MLLAVVALMVVMLAMSVAPALAAWQDNGCRSGDTLLYYLNAQDPSAAYLADGKWNNDFDACQHHRANGTYSYYDNRNVA